MTQIIFVSLPYFTVLGALLFLVSAHALTLARTQFGSGVDAGSSPLSKGRGARGCLSKCDVMRRPER
jgi:hypothetical protein